MSPDLFIRVGLLFWFLIVLALVSNFGVIGAALLMRIKINKVVLCSGSPRFTFHYRGCSFSIGYIPMGGYVSVDPQELVKRPLCVRLFLCFGGLIAVLICIFFCLGFHETVSQVLAGFSQLARAGLAPLSYGRPAIALFFAKAQGSLVAGFGILAAKMMALFVIPIPGTPLGRLLIEILPTRKQRALIDVSSVIVVLASPLFISWSVAAVSYFWQIR